MKHHNKMKAIVQTQYGPPEEVLQLGEVPVPVPGEKEILIKVHATTVNRTDCGFQLGKPNFARIFYGLFSPKNKTLGNEFAGEVAAIGSLVTSFKPGDKVFGYNDVTFGGHAEYLVIKESDPVAIIPENLTFAEAAPIVEGAHYALCDLRAAKVQSGQRILVNGATGAIGSAAVQLAKYFGAEVTAVCGTPNVALVKSLGAVEVLDYMKEDFTKMGKTFDIVFDAVGKSSFGLCKPLLRKGGIYMSTELGPGSQNPFLALLTPLTGDKKVLFPLPTISQEDVEFLKSLVEAGHYRPVIDRNFPLERIVEAYQFVQTGQKVGNVVINVIE